MIDRHGRLRQVLTACGLVLLAGAACRPVPGARVPTSTATRASAPVVATPTTAPLVVIDAGLPAEVQAAVQGWAANAGVQSQVGNAGMAGEGLPGLWAVVALEASLPALAGAGLTPETSLVVVEPSTWTPGERTSTIGPGVAYDEAGFLAGVAAGLASGSGLIGFVPGQGSADEASYRSGFEEGLRYSCPKCRLENASDPARPAFAMDVVALSPGIDLASVEEAGDAPWLVVFGGPPSGAWSDRVAARVHPAPEVLAGPALEELWRGEAGRAWEFTAGTGSLVTEVDDRVISPGRQRLLREAEARLAEGQLAVGGGSGT